MGMPDKVENPKKQKPRSKPDEQGVLAALPSTRPERIGTRRTTTSTATKTARKPAAARRKAAAPRTFEPTPAAEAAAGAADERAAAAARVADAPKPRAVREGAPGMGTTGERGPAQGEPASPEHGRPTGVELVTTAVQAAGELTQIGLSLGGRLVKRAVGRLPKP
jgi:hypothetical protein